MLPQQYEYLAFLSILSVFIWAAYCEEITDLLESAQFWISLTVFMLLCVVLDLVAVHLGWWQFNSAKVCGLWVLSLPVEEVVLFYLIYTLTICAWESRS